MGKIKCISLWQPWASLIAIGAKKIETRSWPTSYRGPILIHAAKSTKGIEALAMPEITLPLVHAGLVSLEPKEITRRKNDALQIKNLPFGAVVCLCNLVDCVRTEELVTRISREESYFGNYGPERFGWMLEGVRSFETPIPLIGKQGLFEVDIEPFEALGL